MCKILYKSVIILNIVGEQTSANVLYKQMKITEFCPWVT